MCKFTVLDRFAKLPMSNCLCMQDMIGLKAKVELKPARDKGVPEPDGVEVSGPGGHIHCWLPRRISRCRVMNIHTWMEIMPDTNSNGISRHLCQ